MMQKLMCFFGLHEYEYIGHDKIHVVEECLCCKHVKAIYIGGRRK